MNKDPSVLAAPSLVLHQEHAVLTGVQGSPLVLWHQPTRDLHAMTNVEEARRLPATITPIFFGVEHLPCLAGRWPTDRAAIIIEKSRLHYDASLVRRPVTLPEGAEWQVCVGDWGIASPRCHPGAVRNFQWQETAYLALQLMKTPDAWWNDVMGFLLPEHALETAEHDRLLRAIAMVAAAKQFHRDHASRYAALRNGSPSDGVAILLRYEQELRSIDREFAASIPCAHRRPFIVGDYGFPQGNWEIFAGTTIPRAALYTPAADAHIAPFRENAARLLAWLEAERPRAVAFRNRSPFCTLEDALFLEELLHRLRIPTFAFFYDAYSHMTNTFEGGWSVPLAVDLCGTERTHHLCADGYIAALYGPRHIPVHHYPFRYLHPDATITPPVATRSALQRDVAIIHQCRDEAMRCPELNELFDLSVAFAAAGAWGGPAHFLLALRQFVQTQAPVCRSYFWQTLLNSIDFNFYSQTRIRWVVAAVRQLKNVSIQVFGSGWDRFLPAHVCAGVVRPEQVADIYRTSGCTIHCSMVNTVRLPHANVVSCLAAGGLPIAVAPAFGDPHELGHAFLNAESIPSFRTPDELETQIQHYVSDWSVRTQYITTAQTGWLAQLHSTAAPSLATLQRSVVVPEKYLPTRMTHDPAVDHWLLQAGLGYLYVLSGFPATALEIWSALLATDAVRYVPLAVRAVSTALEISERTLAHTFWQRARTWSPDSLQVSELGQQHGWR